MCKVRVNGKLCRLKTYEHGLCLRHKKIFFRWGRELYEIPTPHVEGFDFSTEKDGDEVYYMKNNTPHIPFYRLRFFDVTKYYNLKIPSAIAYDHFYSRLFELIEDVNAKPLVVELSNYIM